MKKTSREGLPCGTYHWGHILLALPQAVLLWALFRVNSFLTYDENSAIPEIPDRSLILGYHRDLIYFFCAKRIWRDLSHKESAWIGIHHWASYVGSLELYLRSVRCFRYDRKLPQKPFTQIMGFLNAFAHPVFLRTDAGGPYDQVKSSAIRLAVESQRDIICFRQTGPAYFPALAGHRVPLPFSKIKTSYSKPISWRELADLPLEEARLRVQQEMDTLPKPS